MFFVFVFSNNFDMNHLHVFVNEVTVLELHYTDCVEERLRATTRLTVTQRFLYIAKFIHPQCHKNYKKLIL